MRITGLAGWSGSGKTTLLAKVIPRIVARGLKVSTLKHAHHGFDVDQPGKDSHTHRMAGATEVLVSSANRWALVHELRGDAEPALDALVQKLAPVDLVIVEGFKHGSHPKLEVYRESLGKPLLHPEDPNIVAIASDRPLAADVIAPIDLPPFDNSAVDGYAVRHADLPPGGETRLVVADRLTAGRASARPARKGEAIRIFTGAPMPAGADTVFMQEDCRAESACVVVPAGLAPGANRRLAGEDVRAGAAALPAGRRLGPQHIALAAAL